MPSAYGGVGTANDPAAAAAPGKRWAGSAEGCLDRQTPVEGVVEVVGDDRNLVSSLDEIEVVVAESERVVESRWRRLMTTRAGVVDVGGGG